NLGTAVGWFWFAFTGGLPTIGSFYAGAVIPLWGEYYTFVSSIGLVAAGSIIGLLLTREPIGRSPLAGDPDTPVLDVLRASTFLWRDSRTGIACICRAINTTPQNGFFAMLPVFFTSQLGFGQPRWLFLQGMIYGSNTGFTLLIGAVSDRFGWRRTTTYV